MFVLKLSGILTILISFKFCEGYFSEEFLLGKQYMVRRNLPGKKITFCCLPTCYPINFVYHYPWYTRNILVIYPSNKYYD